MIGEEPREFGDEDFSEEKSKPELESEGDLGEEDYEIGGEEVKFPLENMHLSSSSKLIKEIPIDRLSALPDCLLIHILSFLETRKAASTCVLSKRWQFLWIELPRFEFINSCSYCKYVEQTSMLVEKTRMFLSMVQSALATRTGNNLERFVVRSYYDKSLASDFNVLVEFVVNKRVKEVALLLNDNADNREYYTLPKIVYSDSSFTQLNLGGCIFNSKTPIMWQSLTTLSLDLTTLSLDNIKIRERVIRKILSGCPVLDTLILRKCRALNCLKINSLSVRTLEIDDWDGMDDPLLEISAPYIKSLHVSGRKLRLKNIRSVQAATLGFNGYEEDDSFEQLKPYLTDLFAGLQHVKTLHLGIESIQVISELAETGWQFPESRQACLTVEAGRDAESICGIVALLESFPNLETLVIRSYAYCWERSNWYPPERVDLNCDLLHLKTVDIIDMASIKLAGEPMLTLAGILLKRAIVLEKMVIREDKFPLKQASSFPKISQTLLGLPRSSQEAVVLFA